MARSLQLSVFRTLKQVSALMRPQTRLSTTHSAQCSRILNKVNELGNYEAEELSLYMKPVSNNFCDDIIIRNNFSCSTSRESVDLVLSSNTTISPLNCDNYILQSNFVRMRRIRNEWLRYNLAMKDCNEDIFTCQGEEESPGSEGDEHAKLYEVRDYLAEHLQKFFVTVHNYRLYHPNVILENNYYHPSKTHRGISAYVIQMNKVRWLASLHYAHATFQILKITANEADNTVRVRWRISGLPAMKAFFRFWKFFPGKFRSTMENESEWHDGYSTFYLAKDGLIHKHRVDKVIPDDELVIEKKSGLAAKLSAAISLVIGPAIGAN